MITHNMIRKYIDNQNKGGKSCESILGSLDSLYKVANLFADIPEELAVMVLHEEVNWRRKKPFDSKEQQAFIEGLEALPKFIEKCYSEMMTIENKDK